MNSYPMIGTEIIFTSDLDFDTAVFDDLNNIPCDRFFTRRACEHDRALYAVNPDGLYIWKGTECSLTNNPKPCLAIKDAFLDMLRSLKPHMEAICRLQQYNLRISIQFAVLIDKSMSYPEMVITKQMIEYANLIGAEILIFCDIE